MLPSSGRLRVVKPGAVFGADTLTASLLPSSVRFFCDFVTWVNVVFRLLIRVTWHSQLFDLLLHLGVVLSSRSSSSSSPGRCRSHQPRGLTLPASSLHCQALSRSSIITHNDHLALCRRPAAATSAFAIVMLTLFHPIVNINNTIRANKATRRDEPIASYAHPEPWKALLTNVSSGLRDFAEATNYFVMGLCQSSPSDLDDVR